MFESNFAVESQKIGELFNLISNMIITSIQLLCRTCNYCKNYDLNLMTYPTIFEIEKICSYFTLVSKN